MIDWLSVVPNIHYRIRLRSLAVLPGVGWVGEIVVGDRSVERAVHSVCPPGMACLAVRVGQGNRVVAGVPL